MPCDYCRDQPNQLCPVWVLKDVPADRGGPRKYRLGTPIVIPQADVVGHAQQSRRRNEIDQEMIEKLYTTAAMPCPQCHARVTHLQAADLAAKGNAGAIEYMARSRRSE